MANWDAIVIGLGGVGSSAIYHLAKAGLRVLGIDQYPPVHDLGSSHGKTRIIRQAYFEHPAYVPLLRRSYQLWDELGQLVGKQLLHRTGLVEIGPREGVVISGVLRSAREHALQVEEFPMSEIMRMWPQLVGEPEWLGVIERDAGYLEVEACVAAHLQLAAEHGAHCQHARHVRKWEMQAGQVVVHTDQSTERSAKLLICGGPWSSELLEGSDLGLRVLRKHQYWYRPQQKGFAASEGFPCFFFETPAGFYYGFPALDESGVKVSRHDGGSPLDHPVGPHPADDQDRQKVEAFMAAHLPGIGNDLSAQAGCYYTMTRDEHFVVDIHPQFASVSVVAGLSGHGFKFTSVLGEIASQLVLDGRSSWDTRLFRFNR